MDDNVPKCQKPPLFHLEGGKGGNWRALVTQSCFAVWKSGENGFLSKKYENFII